MIQEIQSPDPESTFLHSVDAPKPQQQVQRVHQFPVQGAEEEEEEAAVDGEEEFDEGEHIRQGWQGVVTW